MSFIKIIGSIVIDSIARPTMEHKFSQPTKRIFEEQDVALFRRSLASKKLHHVISFILEKVTALEVPGNQLKSDIVTRGQAMHAECHDHVTDNNYSPEGNVSILLEILDVFCRLIDETPPLQGPRRFGNMACRDWHAKVTSQSVSLLKKLSRDEDYIIELNHYLINSFGSDMRLDYGSGHELSFIAFVGGLFEQSILEENTSGEDILAIFSKYYDLVRRLILDYSLEPAGSHGVWGLDDHFHFIYILGAAQFNFKGDKNRNTHFQYVPSVLQILSPQTISTYKLSNLYVNAIAFIFKLKLGPFHEHSPVLYDIHKSVTLWSKVQSGLLKMYEVEVFGKCPVVQHFWFGERLYPWVDAATLRPLPVKVANEHETIESTEEGIIPGLINGLQGTKTTNSNFAMTGAPWARNQTARGTPSRAANGLGRSTVAGQGAFKND